MAFCQKEYTFTYNITKEYKAHQPAVFPIDLSCIISPLTECSSMFVIDSMNITAYKQDTSEKVPFKFAVLNAAKTRALTNDPCKLSSKWDVELGNSYSVKIAGTHDTPFNRSLSVYDVENRQTLLNVLQFMMTESLWVSDSVKGSLELLRSECSDKHFTFNCERCGCNSSAHISKGIPGPSLILSICIDNYVCVPSRTDFQPEVQMYRNLIKLIHRAYTDDLDVVREAVTLFLEKIARVRTTGDYRHLTDGMIFIPYQLTNFIVSFYKTLSEYADNFAVVNPKNADVKVLIESSSENVGHITGSLTLTLLHGTSLLDVYENVKEQPSGILEGGHSKIDEAMLQLGYDALIRHFPLNFRCVKYDMLLKDWCRFYYENNSTNSQDMLASSLPIQMR